MPALCSFCFAEYRRARQLDASARQEYLLAGTVSSAYDGAGWCAERAVRFSVGHLIFNRLARTFIPKLDEGTFTMMVYRPSSINIDESTEQQRKTEQEIQRRVPEITTRLFAHRQRGNCDGPDAAERLRLLHLLQTASEWRKIANQPITKEELAKIITTEIENLNPGRARDGRATGRDAIQRNARRNPADIAVKIFGNDYDVLERLGSEVKKCSNKFRARGKAKAKWNTKPPAARPCSRSE
jgi:Cu/Ag efflux pump CusA